MSQRKKYRPRGVSTNPLFIAINGVLLLGKADQAAYALRLNIAVDTIAKGESTQDDWQQVFDVVNMINVMSDDGRIMTGADAFVGRLQDTVGQILDRRKVSGAKALYPAELQDLRDLVGLWAEVLGVITHGEFFKVQEAVAKRVVQAIASKSPKLRVAELA